MASAPSRASTQPETSTSPDLPANTPITLGETTTAYDDGFAYKTVGGYMDVSGGRTMDVSARLRINRLGAQGCSAAVNVTFNGF